MIPKLVFKFPRSACFDQVSPSRMREPSNRFTLRAFSPVLFSRFSFVCVIFRLHCRSVGEISEEQAKLIERDTVERDLTFLGLIMFKNELKEHSRDALDEIQVDFFFS